MAFFTWDRTKPKLQARNLTNFTVNITTVVMEATLKAGRLWYSFIPSLMTVLRVFSPFSGKLQFKVLFQM